jgi:putative ABC transport system permease protein
MSNPNDIVPPQWPLRLIRVFVKKEFLEEIEGDMEEVFRDNVEHMSPAKARRQYVWECLKLFRPILIRNLHVINQITQHAMFKNYFKVSLRGLMKNPLNSSINVIGLSVAIGIAVFVYAFARWTYAKDQFHENKDVVFLATFFADRDGTQAQFGPAPRPLGEMLRNDFPQIKRMARVEDRKAVVKYNDNVFREKVRFADPAFLQMLTFPLKWGTPASLSDLNSVILSEEVSIKYFGEENPVGKSILLKFDQDRSKAFKISGVAAAFPSSHTIEFDFLINFENLKTSDPSYDFDDWSAFVAATLIQVNKASDINVISEGMGKYKKLQNQAAKEEWAISSFAFEPLATLHVRSGDIRDDISYGSSDNFKSVFYLTLVGIFMLALACFNYINIAIVSAAKRLKEIGVRKSIGATRRTVIIQFLSENIVITFFALVFGIVLGMTFFIPGFEYINSFEMDFRLMDTDLWLYLGAVLLVTSIASGFYPSVYISSFQVVGILKGSVKFGTKNPLTKIFLGVQLVLACIFVTSAVMFNQNSRYLANRSWGYNQWGALYASVPDQKGFEQLNAAMLRSPNVLMSSGSAHHLGKSNAKTVLHFSDRDYEVDQLSVDARYFQTMGLQLADGRFFNDHEGSDKHALVVNELLVKNMGWTNPVGQAIHIDSTQYEVVGVVKEFHSYSFFKAVQPTIFIVADKADYRYLSLRVEPGTEMETVEMLQENWSKLFPEIPFDGGYQEDVWGRYYETIAIHATVWDVIGGIAVLLASLGLYGLVTLNVSGRVREFSIRKVLGAGLKNIASSISGQYIVLFGVALTIGAPVSYILIKGLITTAYKYHMPINYSGTLFAVGILILVLSTTVSTQIRKVLLSKPVDGLKVE